MSVFKCKMCGGTLEISENQTTAVCEYCGTQQTLPKLGDDRRAQMYDRANHFRRNNEFDKALGIYEKILNDDSTDAEAYWSIVLCRYGIEYVEDPTTHKRVPTVNRAQFTSIFDDEDYKSALRNADGYQKSIYEEEAHTINEIQKGILAISQREEAFDVFICYKETDSNGRRTQDSVLANDLYHHLTQEGFKVFFSRITLEDKLGTAYEPYIFAALNSAKVMVVIGTKPEYFNAVWVKNEWSRYLALIKNGAKKILIPAYRDMDPYDLPEEFSHLQAQDMSKLGFMQDLIRGIKKLTESDMPQATEKNTAIVNDSNSNVRPLLQRVFIFLEDEDWNNADNYCEKVLDLEPQNAEAYLGKLMAALHVRNREDLKDYDEPFDNDANFQKAVRFADEKLKKELKDCIDYINIRNENFRLDEIYNRAKNAKLSAKTEIAYKRAAELFESISEYQDSAALAAECYDDAEVARKDEILAKGKAKMNAELLSKSEEAKYEEAIKIFESISGWKDADEQSCACRRKIEEIKAQQETERLERERQIQIVRKEAERKAKRNKKIALISTPIVCVVITFFMVLNAVIIPNNKYAAAIALMDNNVIEAYKALIALDGYKDSADKVKEISKTIRELNADTISAGSGHTIGLKSDGTVVATEYKGSYNYGQCDVEGWSDIVAVSTGSRHTVGLKSDGTVVAIGDNTDGRCDVEGWSDIVAVSAGWDYTVGLKSDGTVVAVGSDAYDQCNVENWSGIVAVSTGEHHTIGLKFDGTVVAVGVDSKDQCNVEGWSDIVAVFAGTDHTVGLKSDGTVVATEYKGLYYYGQCDVDGWSDIVAISAGDYHTVGLKSDGTVVAVGANSNGQCDVEGWSDIVAVSAEDSHTVGLKSDGTVVAVGDNSNGQCDVEGWSNIKLPKNK